MIHPHEFSEYSAFEKALLEKIDRLAPMRILLSGGSLTALFPLLSEHLPEGREFFLCDERLVPLDHPESNSGALLRGIDTQKHHCFPWNPNFPSDIIPEFLRAPVDLALLGIGTDGHVASVFPESSSILKDQGPLLFALAPQQYLIQQRVSLSLPQIFASRHLFFVLFGKEKQSLFFEMRNPKKAISHFPAHFFANHPFAHLFWSHNKPDTPPSL